MDARHIEPRHCHHIASHTDDGPPGFTGVRRSEVESLANHIVGAPASPGDRLTHEGNSRRVLAIPSGQPSTGTERYGQSIEEPGGDRDGREYRAACGSAP